MYPERRRAEKQEEKNTGNLKEIILSANFILINVPNEATAARCRQIAFLKSDVTDDCNTQLLVSSVTFVVKIKRLFADKVLPCMSEKALMYGLGAKKTFRPISF